MSGCTNVLRRARTLGLLLLPLIIVLPCVARAVPAPTDRVGGRSITAEPTLVAAAPDVEMPAGVLQTSDGRVLWARDAEGERAMASTTKIMTALIVLERADLDGIATVSEDAVAVGEASAGLVAGQQLSVRTLLEALLVRSANDAAVVLAEHVAGSIGAFVTLMNDKAVSLGLVHTSFANPHGLDEPGHFTSAGDLAALARLAMKDPIFAEMVAAPDVTVPIAGGGVKRYETTNRLVVSYAGATGVKTGWTDAAGYCVVASAERDAIGLVAVVLGSASDAARSRDVRALLDWGFEHYARVPLSSAEETVALIPIADYLDATVAATVAESTSAVLFDLDGAIVQHLDVREDIPAPVVAGQRLGTLSVVQNGRLVAQVPVIAATSVPAPDLSGAVEIWFTRLWRAVFGGALEAAPVPLM